MSANVGSDTIVTNGLVLYLDAANYKSYTSSSIVWRDLTDNGNSGSLMNGTGFTFNNAGSFLFDGINDYLTTNIGSLRSLTGTRSTLTMWFKTTNSVLRQALLADWNSVGYSETVRIEISGYFLASTKIGGTINVNSGTTPVQSTTSIQNNQWYSVTIMYDGTKMQLYLNDILESSLVQSERGSNGDGHVSIGRGGDYNALFFNGSIPIVQVYNRALSAQEVLQNYNALKGRFGL